MKYLKYLVLLCGGLALTGCHTYRGGTEDPYDYDIGGATQTPYVPADQAPSTVAPIVPPAPVP
jgi:hypothetical protein